MWPAAAGAAGGAAPPSATLLAAVNVHTLLLGTLASSAGTVALTFAIWALDGTIDPKKDWPMISDLWWAKPDDMISRFLVVGGVSVAQLTMVEPPLLSRRAQGHWELGLVVSRPPGTNQYIVATSARSRRCGGLRRRREPPLPQHLRRHFLRIVRRLHARRRPLGQQIVEWRPPRGGAARGGDDARRQGHAVLYVVARAAGAVVGAPRRHLVGRGPDRGPPPLRPRLFDLDPRVDGVGLLPRPWPPTAYRR